MSEVAKLLVAFLCSPYGTMFLMGSAGYFLYCICCCRQVRRLSASVTELLGQPSSSQFWTRKSESRQSVACIICVFLGLTLLAYGLLPSVGDDTCDADVSIATSSQAERGADRLLAASPLWAKMETNDIVPLTMPLKFMRNPIVWRPTVADTLSVCGRSSHGEHPPLQQLQEQLECFDGLMESPGTRRETADAIVTRSKEVISSMRERASEQEDLLDVAEVAWARIAPGGFQMRCSEVGFELQELKVSQPPVDRSMAALRSMVQLHEPFKEAVEAISRGLQVANTPDHREAGDQQAELQNSLSALRSCMIKNLLEARTVALSLPLHDTLVKKAVRCRPYMLAELEDMVLQEAEQGRDASTLFGLGLYLSHVAVSAQVPPFFKANQEAKWVRDVMGAHVPERLARAEALLVEGVKTSVGNEREERLGVHAVRLYQHAKLLALENLDVATEWRYREAASAAASSRRPKLAAHSLARLAYFLSLRGRQHDALSTAGEALEHSEDALGLHIHMTLRRSLGLLQTSEEITEAEERLGALAEQLPSKVLEEQRAQAHADLRWWREVAELGTRHCFTAHDAADFVICLLCRPFFRNGP